MAQQLQHLLAEILSHSSSGPSLFIAKVTLLLGLAWLAHLLMKRMNPQWHIYLWRFVSMGVVLLLITTGFNLIPVLKIELPSTPITTESIIEDSANVIQTVLPEGIEQTFLEDTATPLQPISPLLATSTIVPQTPEPSPVSLQSILTAIWACGALFILGRMAFGSWRLRSLIANTEEPPLDVAQLGRQIEQQMGLRQHVTLKISASISSPIVLSQRKPVQVLPAYLCAKEHRSKLTAILAHELNHVRSKDLRWNHLLQLLEAALWFHPLVWRIRAAHTSACELAADAASANLIGNAKDYCRILATVALKAGGVPVASGMAMARKSDVRLRLERLPETLKKLPIRRRTLMAGITAACLVVLTIGGLQVAQAAEADRPTQLAQEYQTALLDEEYEETITLLWDVCHNRANLNSVEQIAFFEQIIQETSTIPENIFQPFTEVLERQSGLFTYKENEPEWIPFDLYILRLMKLLKPEQVRAAKHLRTPMRQYGLIQISDAHTSTPGEVALSKLLNQEYTYHTGTQYSALPEPSNEQTNKTTANDTGLHITGKVIDVDGQPVSAAKLMFGYFGSNTRYTTTDSLGHFRLEGLPERQWTHDGGFFTVYGAGITPYVHLLDEPESIDDLKIQLEAPQFFRVRIVDPDGNPLRASIQANYMKGKRSLYGAMIKGVTDKNGEWTWETAPSEPVKFEINGMASMEKRIELQATGETHLITLKPALVIQGTVIDAETRQPIPNFTYQAGQLSGTRFSQTGSHVSNGTNGSFTQYFERESRLGHMLKIQAEGYTTTFMPAETNGGLVEREFALTPSSGIQGTLLQPDGSPAADTTILLLTKDERLWGDLDKTAQVGSQKWQTETNAFDKTKTNAAGGFSLPEPGVRYKLLVASDQGVCIVSKAEFEEGNKILQLKPWANIEGQLFIEGKPAAGETVLLNNPPYILRSKNIEIQWQKKVTTDSDGRFSLKRIPPGIYRVCRLINNTASAPATAVDARPGKTVEIVLQNHGRTIQGQIDWSAFTVPLKKQTLALKPARIGFRTDYQLSDDEQNESAYQFWKSDAAVEELQQASQQYAFTCNDDGGFTIADVAPGTYELNIWALTAQPNSGNNGRTPIGGYAMIVDVPALDNAEETSINLGNIQVFPKRESPLSIGDRVPDFEFETLDGTKHRLHDLLGRPILLSAGGGWTNEANYRKHIPSELDLTIVQISGGYHGKKDPHKTSNFETGFFDGFVMPMATNLGYLLGENHKWRFYLINKEGIVEKTSDNYQNLAELF